MSLTYLQPSILTSGEAQLPWLLRPPPFLLTQQRQDYNYKAAQGIADSQEQSIPALSRASNVWPERKERVNFTEGFPQLCLDRLFMEASNMVCTTQAKTGFKSALVFPRSPPCSDFSVEFLLVVCRQLLLAPLM